MLRFAAFAVLVASLLFAAVGHARGTTRVRSYFKKNGTYVQPHRRTSPDSTVNNNWGTKGNVNLYTGKVGTKKAR